MKSNLLLTLWLIGGLLYAGSTLFLANALFGGIGVSSDSSKVATAAPDDQCKKENVASGTDPATTAAVQIKEEAKAAAGNQQQSRASSPVAAPKVDPSAQAGSTSQDSAAPSDEAALGPEDGELPPWHSEGVGPQDGEEGTAQEVGEGEWAHVVAGTADMRSEPSLSSQMIYALPSGWQVRVISKVPGWVQVQDANSGASGWVDATAVAPLQPDERNRYGGYPAEQGDPFGEPVERPRPRGGGQFGDFLRRAFGG